MGDKMIYVNIISLIISLAITPLNSVKPVEFQGKSYIVMEASNQVVIEGSNEDYIQSVASISKIMTCILAIENMDLDTKYSPKLTLYNTKNKNKQVVKISKALFNKIPLSEYDAIKIKKVVPKPRKKKVDGEWTNLSVTDYWIIDYEKV